MRSSTGLPARKVALGLFAAALARRGGLEAALAGADLARLPPEDRGFARALTLAALRDLGPIDRALGQRLVREPPAPVRDILRLALAGAWRLNTPAFAAVDTAVSLAPAPLRGLVNAVLRRALEAGPPSGEPQLQAPAWLFARWSANFGADEALGIAGEIAREPATDLTFRNAEQSGLAAALEAQPLGCGSFRTLRGGDPAAWPGFAQGRWWVQDVAAAAPARLIAPAPGERILDLCAAPGGKTLQLAAAGAQVTALDLSRRRLERLRDNLRRTGLAAEVVACDALAWTDRRTFEAVLLDAPCSATGTFRRHPDVLWNARPGDIAGRAALQARLLDAAADRLEPKGRLVYAVCSLEPEEGEGQIRAFLARRPGLRLAPADPATAALPAAALAPQGWLRILPHQRPGGLDGFFIACLRRD